MRFRFFFMFLCAAPSIANAKWTTPDHLNLKFYSTTPHAASDQLEATWSSLCPAWGKKMLHGKGPLGGGIFLHFSCYEEDRLIEGDRVDTPWELEIRSDTKAFSLTMLYGKEVLTQLKFPSISHPISLLQDAEFSTYSVLSLLDSLAVFRRVTKEDVSANQLPSSVPLEGVVAPLELTLYHLELSTEKKMIWRPHVVASATKQDANGGFSYQLPASVSKLDFTTPIWAHNQQGPGHLAAMAKPIVEQKYRQITQSFLENAQEAFATGFDKGHVGFRFGLPMINGDTLGRKTSFVGLISEFRHGPLKGLNLSIDYWPTSTNSVDGGKASFGGSRENLGWTYSVFPIKKVPTLSFGLTPKVGIWNMKIVVPSEGKEIPFSVKNSVSLGLSAQTEYTRQPFLFRLFYENSFSVKFAFQSTQVMVDRTGLDFYWSLGQVGFLPKSVGVSPLAFMFNETFVFKKSASQSDLDSQEIAITKLSYTQLYLGCGVALTW